MYQILSCIPLISLIIFLIVYFLQLETRLYFILLCSCIFRILVVLTRLCSLIRTTVEIERRKRKGSMKKKTTQVLKVRYILIVLCNKRILQLSCIFYHVVYIIKITTCCYIGREVRIAIM